MFAASLKIYGLANLLLGVFFFFASLCAGVEPEALIYPLLTVIFTSTFSLPGLLMLWGLLSVIKAFRLSPGFSWLTLLLLTGIIAAVPCLLLIFIFHVWTRDLTYLFLIAVLLTYLAVFLLADPIHQLFKSFQHER